MPPALFLQPDLGRNWKYILVSKSFFQLNFSLDSGNYQITVRALFLTLYGSPFPIPGSRFGSGCSSNTTVPIDRFGFPRFWINGHVDAIFKAFGGIGWKNLEAPYRSVVLNILVSASVLQQTPGIENDQAMKAADGADPEKM